MKTVPSLVEKENPFQNTYMPRRGENNLGRGYQED
jgi:hypothetical protein